MTASDSIRAVVELWAENDSHLSTQLPSHCDLNDSACFLLLFGQLESAIDHGVEQVYGPSGTLEFRARLRLLEGVINGELLDAIDDDYTLRCELAHGRRLGASINVALHANDYLEALHDLE